MSVTLPESGLTADGTTERAPLVSVLIPAYQVSSCIAEALDSVMSQTFSDYEVIVVNDGSPDTEELERVLAPYMSRIVYIRQENRGAAAARNTGLRAARGSFVAFLDADDCWSPDYLEQQLQFIQDGPGYDVVYADALIIGDSPLAGRTYMETSPSVGSVTFESLLTQQCGVITSGLLARTQLIRDVGLFDEELRRAHDYDLWLRLSKAGARFNYQRKVLLRYRSRPDSLSGDAITSIERDLIVLDKTALRTDLTPNEREALQATRKRREALLNLERGKLELLQGNFATASHLIREADQYFRSFKLKIVLLWLRSAPRLLLRVYGLGSDVQTAMSPEPPAPTRRAEPDRLFSTAHLTSDLRGRTTRGGTIMVTSQTLKFILNLASASVLARLLTPRDYGLIAMVAVVTGFSYPFRNLGLSAATIQRAEITYKQVSTLFWINVGLSLATALVTIGISPIVAWFYGEQRLIWITVAMASVFIFEGLGIQHEALLKRQMRFLGLAATEISSMVIGSSTAIILAWYGAGYWALVFSQLAIGATYAAGVWLACRWRPGLPVRVSGVRSMLAFGRKLSGNNTLNYIARNLDNLLIGRYWGSQQLGLYARAYQLLLLPLEQISAPVDGVAVSALSRLTDSPSRYRRAYLRMLEKVAMLTMPGTALMILTSDWLVRVVLGPHWSETGRIFALLGLVGLVEPISSTMGWLLISQGRGRHVLRLGVIDATLSIISIIVGLPWGVNGVAASYALIGLCIRKPFQFWFVGRVGPVRTADFYRAILPSVYASLSVVAALLLFRQWAQGTRPIVGLVASTFIGTVVALLCFLLLPKGRQALLDVKNLLPLLLRRGSAAL